MGLKKEIENRKKIINVKTKLKDVVDSVTHTVQSTVNTFNTSIDSVYYNQVKKNIYEKTIIYVESLIINANIETLTDVKISVEKLDGFTSISEIIEKSVGTEASNTIFEKDNYIKTIFDVLVNYFSEEDDIEMKTTKNTIIIKLKNEIIESN